MNQGDTKITTETPDLKPWPLAFSPQLNLAVLVPLLGDQTDNRYGQPLLSRVPSPQAPGTRHQVTAQRRPEFELNSRSFSYFQGHSTAASPAKAERNPPLSRKMKLKGCSFFTSSRIALDSGSCYLLEAVVAGRGYANEGVA